MKNYFRIKKMLVIIFFANIVVAAAKIVIGILISSSSMTADGFHSVADSSSNIIALIGITLAVKTADPGHPYGYGKYENMAGLFIAIMLFILGGKVMTDAVIRFIHPMNTVITIKSIIILIITIIINFVVSYYEIKKGRELESTILVADALHTRSDIFVSLGVLVTLFSIKAGLPVFIDPLVSIAVSGIIICTSVKILKSTSGILVDKAAADSGRISEIAGSFKDVVKVYGVKSRGGKNELYIDMNIIIEGDMSVACSHELLHEIENKLAKELGGVIRLMAHIEPSES